MKKSFAVTLPTIQIKHVAGSISIIQSNDEQTHVTLDGDDSGAAKVEQRGQTITVSQEQRRRLRRIIVSNLNIVVEAPTASKIDIATIAGDVNLRGTFNGVTAKTVSGSLVARVSAPTIETKTISGELDLSFDTAAQLAAKSVSGDITIAVATGLGVDVDVKSLSGNVTSEISLDGEAAGLSLVSCRATSISGDIRLERIR